MAATLCAESSAEQQRAAQQVSGHPLADGSAAGALAHGYEKNGPLLLFALHDVQKNVLRLETAANDVQLVTIRRLAKAIADSDPNRESPAIRGDGGANSAVKEAR